MIHAAVLLLFALPPQAPAALPPQAPPLHPACVELGCACGCLEDKPCLCGLVPLMPHKTYAEWKAAAHAKRSRPAPAFVPPPAVMTPAPAFRLAPPFGAGAMRGGGSC